MGKIDARKVMNGTFGTVRINGLEYGNIQKIESKITFEREDIQFSGSLGKDSKMIATTGSGSMSFKKVNSRNQLMNIASLVSGKDFKMTLILTLDDPDAEGRESFSIEAWTDDFDLFNFEIGSTVEENISFGFNPQSIIPLDSVVA